MAALALPLAMAGCHGATEQMPGDHEDHRPFAGISKAETLHFTGTEPFWGGEASGDVLVWRTPENPQGERVSATRFAGRGGASVSATLSAGALTLAATPAQCSDGMSDRVYPFEITVEIAGEVRQGCGWTDSAPFKEASRP